MMSAVLGTILISRNFNEAENTSLGFWNHVAIYTGDDSIVEAQDVYGVIQTPLAEYAARPYTWFSMRPKDEALGQLAAEHALTLVGLPYRPYSSARLFRRFEERGLNCVDAGFRIPYEHATGQKFPRVHTPDDVAELAGSMFIR